MKKRSLLIPMLASAALLLASCDIMPPDFRNYSYPEESSSSQSSKQSSSSSNSSSSESTASESTSSESTSTSASESTSGSESTSTSESTESTQSTESSESSESSEEEGVTATKNGQAVALTEITPGESDKAAYSVELAVGDVLALKDGETALHFYHWEGQGESGHAEDDGATYTATVAGVHKIYYGNDGKLWINEPEPEPSSTTVEITLTFTNDWAKSNGAVFYVAAYEAGWTSMTWHEVDANDKATIPDSTVNFIVVRMDPSKIAGGPSWDAKWNQSGDMTYTAGTTTYSISLS